MEIDSRNNLLRFEHFSIFGFSVSSSVNSVRAICSLFDQTVKQLLQKAKFIERKVSEAEIVHAEEINMKVNNSVAIKSKQTSIQSSDYVNISSDLINMG
ncbi:DUF3540 domain-containing protein [Piscirickettsia litoralis]|uniref:Uncharacterized protein n=1 Tax=Piscirickettsia litoralis TaxID=1891921 RepID=A0ABX3A0Y6_9GAMM|nr:DUF3540 domain-containing protein [Piscirickettsia litoralis]ODN42521.1 hypothetical protein BGC07_05760 [Piscirickettsia litoralis]